MQIQMNTCTKIYVRISYTYEYIFAKHSTYVDAYIYARTLTFKIHAHNRTPMSIFKRPSRQISEINEVIIGISLSIARHLPLKE